MNKLLPLLLLALLLAGCGTSPPAPRSQLAQRTTATATPQPTATATVPPTPTATPDPPPPPPPTLTPRPTPTAIPASAHRPPLNNGDTWVNDGWALSVSNFTYETFHTIHFTLENRTDRNVRFPAFSTDQFRITSDAGDTFAPCSIRGSGWYNTVWNTKGPLEIAAGESIAWEWKFYRYDPQHRACDTYSQSAPTFASDAHTLTLTVENLGDTIVNARWSATIPRP